MSEALHIGPVGQIARRVKDIAAARQWYGEVLGLKHLYSFGDLAFFDCGGMRLFLSQDGSAEQPESILYFRVPDINAAAERVKKNGGTILNGPMEVPGGDWIVNAMDPQGAAFSLHARKAQ